MNSAGYRRLYFIFSTLLLSTTHVVAQDGNFFKQLLKEGMKETMKDMMMKPNQTKSDSLNNISERKTHNLEIDPTKITIPINASFNYSLDSLKKVVETYLEQEVRKKELVISPGFFEQYKELPIDAYYNKTPVFIDGKWIPQSALGGGGFSPLVIVGLLFGTGIIKDNPLPPTKSKKEKALERSRATYGTKKDKKWDGDPSSLNEAINRLREEAMKKE